MLTATEKFNKQYFDGSGLISMRFHKVMELQLIEALYYIENINYYSYHKKIEVEKDIKFVVKNIAMFITGKKIKKLKKTKINAVISFNLILTMLNKSCLIISGFRQGWLSEEEKKEALQKELNRLDAYATAIGKKLGYNFEFE